MSIQFGPLYGLPMLLDATPPGIVPGEIRGWWMLPAMIAGFVECVGIIGWIVA